MHNTYLYIISSEGVASEQSYPFKAKVLCATYICTLYSENRALTSALVLSELGMYKRCGPFYTQQGTCEFDKKKVGALMTGSVSIQQGSERDLQAAVATAGPVAVAVDARNKAFRVCLSQCVR